MRSAATPEGSSPRSGPGRLFPPNFARSVNFAVGFPIFDPNEIEAFRESDRRRRRGAVPANPDRLSRCETRARPASTANSPPRNPNLNPPSAAGLAGGCLHLGPRFLVHTEPTSFNKLAREPPREPTRIRSECFPLPTSHLYRPCGLMVWAGGHATAGSVWSHVPGRSRTARSSQGAFTMNRTHLQRPNSRGSLFQWSVADRTVAAYGIDPNGEQPPCVLILAAWIADDRGRFPANHARCPMNRKIFSGRPLRRGTWPEVTAAEKKPRFGAYPARMSGDFDGNCSEFATRRYRPRGRHPP